MTEDIQESIFDKKVIDMIATTIQHQMGLIELDSMFQKAEENLDSIYQNLRVNQMTRERAFGLLGKMTVAQKEYDTYFGKGRINESEIPAITRPLAYQLAAYHVFIQHNQSVLNEACVVLEENYDKTKGLTALAFIEDASEKAHARTPEQKIAETGIWVYK